MISPVPSAVAGRVSNRTTCGCGSRNSAMSSSVMMRSVVGTSAASALRSVVLPDDVAPLTSTLQRAPTMRVEQIGDVGRCERGQRQRRVWQTRRIVRHGPSTATGWMTAHTREPSGKRASTVGFERSIRRPIGRRMCSIAVVTADVLIVATRSKVPERSIQTSPVPLTITSSIAGSPSHRSRPPERRAFGDDIDHAALRNEMSNDFGSRAIKRPASTARATAGSRRTSATTGTPSACSISADVSARPGSSTSTIPVGRISRC